MSSGVKVDPGCATEFQKLKMKKTHSIVVYKLSDDNKSIVVDWSQERPVKEKPHLEAYDILHAYLLEVAAKGECRYASLEFDFEYLGKRRNKVIFIKWNPEGAKVKQKMLYTSSEDYLKKALQLTDNNIQATDADEISLDHLIEKSSKFIKD